VSAGNAKKEMKKSQHKLPEEQVNKPLESPEFKDPGQNTMAVVKPPEFDADPNSLATQRGSRKVIGEVPQVAQKAVDVIDRPSVSPIKSDYATEALLNDDSNEEQENIAQENGARKGALRGLLRKANRFVNKVTNPDTNGPSVKVASFEIALAK
jgi:hypothetical protein